MKIHVFQHVPFEGPGGIAAWAKQHHGELGITQFYEPGWFLPDIASVDMLVVMGGPMGVHDEESYPSLAVEKAFIKDCIDAGKKVMGICLGAQLIAHVLGAEVAKNAHKEIGWFDIRHATPHPLFEAMPHTQTVFHWHGDRFALPEGAVHLARSVGCEQQAFLWKEHVLGLQYHIEMGPPEIEAILENCGHELEEAGEFIQSAAHIRDNFASAEALRSQLFTLLDKFTA